MILNNGIEIENSSCIEEAIRDAYDDSINPIVVIRCITYNQKDYVAETLDSFVSQDTDFPFIAIVHDDASNDGTREIIKEYATRYPKIIKAVCDDVNRYSQRTLGHIMDTLIEAYDPLYVAICEGDDYWTDKLKLQKQVDYMENNPECVMCHGDYEIINGKKRKALPHYDEEPFFGPGHVHDYTIVSLTVLYRYKAYKKLPHYAHDKKWLMGDLPLWIELSREGKFHYFPEVFGKYRVLANSASHSTNAEQIIRFWECGNDIVEFYSKLYGYNYEERPRKTLYWRIQYQCYENHDKIQAKKYWKEGQKYKANNIKSFVYYICNIFNARWLIDLIYKILE